MEFVMIPIGILHSPFIDKKRNPTQSTRSHACGYKEVFAEFAEGLQDLEGFSHIILLYIFHQSENYTLKFKLFRDDQLRGLFATRYPYRPNPIGLSIVQLVSRCGSILDMKGIAN
jgi:tRNA-Thr(GGU) m(6)t(6)A37 methyltransferase TsaA